MVCPPRCPDFTPCDFFLWGNVEDRVFVPTLPRDLTDLKARITAAVKNIEAPMLKRVWQELEYHNNIYLLQMGCHPVAVITLHVFPNTATKFT
jgi:hypothetical protein